MRYKIEYWNEGEAANTLEIDSILISELKELVRWYKERYKRIKVYKASWEGMNLSWT